MTEKNGIEKVGLEKYLLGKKFPKLQWRDECILIAFFYNSVTKIAQENVYRKHKISRSSFYRRIKKLSSYGVIHKNEETPISEYYIDPIYKQTNPIFLSLSQGLSPIFESPRKSSPFDEKIIRSHNYLFLSPIEHSPAKLAVLLRKDNWMENTKMKNWPYFYGPLGLEGIKATIQFNPKTINIRILQVFGRDPHEDDQEANRQLLEIKAYLEKRYPRLRMGPGKFLTKAINTGRHHGWVHHPLALKAKKQNLSFEKQYWNIDSSKGFPELDAHDRLKASEHMEKELEDFDYRAEKEVYFKDLDQYQNEIAIILENTSKIQKEIINQHGALHTGQLTHAQIILGILEQTSFAQQNAVKDQNVLVRFIDKMRSFIGKKSTGKKKMSREMEDK